MTTRSVQALVTRKLWIVPLAVGLPAVVGYFWLPPAAENVAYEGFGVMTTLAVVIAVLLHQPERARLWLLVGLGFALWTAGDAVSALLSPDGGDVPVPSWADASYFCGYAAMILGAGLLAGPIIHSRTLDRPALLDAAILATGIGFGVWLTLLHPLLDEPDVDLATGLVGAAYPILDVLLIAVVARHLLVNGPKPPAAVLLAAGLGIYLLGDLAYVREAFLGTYSAADPVNAGWLAGYAFAGAAVLHPSMARVGMTDEEMRPLSRVRRVLLASAAVVPAWAMFLHDSWDFADRIVLGCASAVLVGLVLARLFGALGEQQHLRARMHHEARHDPLTGLANRALFGERLTDALAAATVGTGLLYLDLDGFKAVNDRLGHEAGDELLAAVAARLRARLRVSDDVARLGGDEFTVIIEGAVTGESAVVAATRIIDALGPTVDVGAERVAIRASVGIAWSQPGALTAREILRRADVAMYAAKAARSRYCLYGPELEVQPELTGPVRLNSQPA